MAGLGRVGNTLNTCVLPFLSPFLKYSFHELEICEQCLKASVNFVFFQLSKQFLSSSLILTGRKAKYVYRCFADLSPKKKNFEKKIEKKRARRKKEEKRGEKGVKEREKEGAPDY